MTIMQKTIAKEISFVGTGLHTGKKVKVTLKPLPDNSGILFQRTDIKGNGTIIPALFANVVDTRLCTCLGNKEGINVSTIEHIMSALHGIGISNLLIEITGDEMPLLDGSSKNFAFLLNSAGIREQTTPAKILRIKKSVTIKENDAFITINPSAGSLSIDFTLDYASCPFIGRQNYHFSLTQNTYEQEIAPARTFGLAKEIEQIRAIGLAKGGSLENVVIATDTDVLNPEGLRFRDEFVRHKILDTIGDFYTSGYPILGHITASKSGHKLNNLLLKELFSKSDAFDIIEASDYIEDNSIDKRATA